MLVFYLMKNLRLLNSVEVGKLLFGFDNSTTNSAYRKRVIRLIYSANLPMKKIAGKWLISSNKLNRWIILNDI